jgi:hypothetical protein
MAAPAWQGRLMERMGDEISSVRNGRRLDVEGHTIIQRIRGLPGQYPLHSTFTEKHIDTVYHGALIRLVPSISRRMYRTE